MKRITFALITCLAFGLLLPAVSFAVADLGINKSGPSTVVAGTDLIYTISVFNNGPGPATNVQVQDIFSLPSVGEGGLGQATCADGNDNDTDGRIDSADDECHGLFFVGGTASCTLTGVNANEGTISCALPNLASGDSTTLSIKFHVSPMYLFSKSFFISNKATVSAAEADPATGNNTDVIQTIVEEVADLRVTKISPSGTVPAGEIFVYTIYVDNFGPSAARNVTIRDTLLNTETVTISSCAFSVSQGDGAITQFTCTTGPVVETQFGTDIGTFKTNVLYPLTPTSEGRLRGSFRVTPKMATGITNVTRVASNTPDPNMDNNEVELPLTVTAVADLQAFSVFGAEVQTNGLPGKTVDTNLLTPMPDPDCCNFGGTTVTAGRRIQWETTVTNNGPSPAENVRIEVLLPFGATVIENTLTASPNPGPGFKPGRCDTEPAGQLRNKVICEYGTLDPPGFVPGPNDPPTPNPPNAALRFLVLIDPSVLPGTQLSFDAIARSDQFDPNLSNNVTSIQFDVNARADLKIEKFVRGQVVEGKAFTYELQVSNKGPSVADDVTLHEVLPAGVKFLSAFIDYEGTPDGVTEPLPCTIGAWNNELFCPIETIPPTGAYPVVVFINVQVKPGVVPGSVLTNVADVLLADTPDPLVTDNSDQVNSTVAPIADLALSQNVNLVSGSPSSQRIKFTVKVKNKGPSTANNVVVTNTLPPAGVATYLSDSQGCTKVGNTLTCNLGTMVKFAEKKINIFFRHNGPDGVITNSATLSSNAWDPVSSNNTSTKTIRITGGFFGGSN